MTVNRDLANYAQVADQNPSFRNLIINGAMQVAQRGTSVTGITTSGYYTADRWNLTPVSLGTWTQTVENDAPAGSGFRKSLKLLCTTADASPAASDVLRYDYRIEGQNLQAIKKGTANAEQLTLSFWVKSNVTGTYVVGLYEYDNTRYVAQSYTISASATWEKKTITFPADTTGVLDNDNATSLEIEFGLATGTDRSSGTLATTWQSYTATNALVGQTNLAAATNNYWQITGVQLEVGAVATPFEFKPYAQDLAECQRYYQIIEIGGNGYQGQYNGAVFYGEYVSFINPMRATPIGSYQHTGLTQYWVIIGVAAYSGNSNANISFDFSPTSVRMVQPRPAGGSTPTTGNIYVFEASFRFLLSAEL